MNFFRNMLGCSRASKVLDEGVTTAILNPSLPADGHFGHKEAQEAQTGKNDVKVSASSG